MSRTLVAETVVGHHLTGGTEWPVVTQLHRHGPRDWVVTDALCNGVPDGATTHKTRKEALAEYQRQLDAWVRRGAKLETIK